MNPYADAYAEYDALRVVRRREIVGMTNDGYKVRHKVTVYDFNKPTLPPPNPDAVIAPKNRAPRQRHVATETLLAEIRALLVCKPMIASELAAALDLRPYYVSKTLLNNPDGFVVLARGLTGNVWGIEGVKYTPVYTGALGQIVDYLREHGQATARDICDALNMPRATFYAANNRHPGVLRCTETRIADDARGGLVQIWEMNA